MDQIKNSGIPMSEFRSWYYDDLKENYSKFFNFFFENNDIFNIISEEDEQSLKIKHMEYLNCTFNWTIGSFLGVLVTDKIILRYLYPNFRIQNFRATLFLGKYIGIPLLGFKIAQDYFTKDVDEVYRQMAEKYSFNYQDYNRVMDILERAQRVNRLQELLEQRNNFDWTGVPEFSTKQYEK